MKQLNIFLFVLWLILGVIILVNGHITRIMYGCIWVCYLIELWKQIFDNDDNDFIWFV